MSWGDVWFEVRARYPIVTEGIRVYPQFPLTNIRTASQFGHDRFLPKPLQFSFIYHTVYNLDADHSSRGV
jgi:hypothetical protein